MKLTTVHMDMELLKPAKHLCIDLDISMREYVSRLIKADLEGRK